MTVALRREALLAEGRPLRLGRRIGRGGEGEVFAVAGDPAHAAKLYAPEGAQAREAKVAAMVRARLAEDAPLVAFPLAEIRAASGRFAGFLMRRVAEAEPLHELYAPGARKRAFPEADHRFLMRAALNTARAVAAAHATGVVIGDVNHSGFLIGRDALASLIDADSFQVRDGADLHLCRVGVPDYTPPELIGLPLADTPRAPDHDAFGLAVILFQLLFLGRHPFAGVSRAGDLPLAGAIARHAFAFSRRRTTDLAPPPGALRLDEIAPPLADRFERAFAPEAPGRRPTAADWVAALEAAEASLAPCGADARHHRPAELSVCPWCRIERETRAPVFPAPGTPGAAPPPLDARAALARLAAIALPETFAYAPPAPLPFAPPPPPPLRKVIAEKAFVAAVAVMMACAAGLVFVSPQNFLMASPICIYGVGPVGDALFPRRAARRALAKHDRNLADALAEAQRRIDLDAAWLLKAELAAVAARLPAAPPRRGGRVADPARRADADRLARDIPRLEAMAEALAAARSARVDAVETLLARRALLAEALAARGETPPPPPAAPLKTLRDATRRRLSLPA
jgi:hypothetical protein